MQELQLGGSSGTTTHASAVLVGRAAALIRGEPGSGKSRLAMALIDAAQAGLIPFARLVADDRTELEPCHGRLLARPPAVLAGLIEVRGLGVRRLGYEPVALVGFVVDLAADDGQRLPLNTETEIAGVRLPRLGVTAGENALPLVLAYLRSKEA